MRVGPIEGDLEHLMNDVERQIRTQVEPPPDRRLGVIEVDPHSKCRDLSSRWSPRIRFRQWCWPSGRKVMELQYLGVAVCHGATLAAVLRPCLSAGDSQCDAPSGNRNARHSDSRQQRERGDVGRSYDGEVAPVNGGDLGDAQSFGSGDDRCIDRA